MRHHHSRALTIGSALVLSAFLAAPTAQADLLKPAHVTLRHQKAQGNREQIFQHLLTGSIPTRMQGKSRAEIERWSARMQNAIYKNGRKIVQRIAANPGAPAAKNEAIILGLLSPAQRAQLLKDVAGFKVEKVRYKVEGQPTDKLKVTLGRHGMTEYSSRTQPKAFSDQMSIYNRVMSPNAITFMPAGGHSKYVSGGAVVDLWDNNDYGAVRPHNYTMFPTWLSDREAQRMKQVFDVGNTSWSSALGTQMYKGRPGMWPPTPRQTQATGNSCTTTFIRAPVGARDARYSWIDELQKDVRGAAKAGRLRIGANVDLSQQKLLEAVTGMTPEQYRPIFASLRAQMPGKAAQIDRLQGEVDFFFDRLKGVPPSWTRRLVTTAKSTFPMDLMHRTPLATMANIKGDPVGPKGATQKFRGADPKRIGVVTVFEKQ